MRPYSQSIPDTRTAGGIKCHSNRTARTATCTIAINVTDGFLEGIQPP